MTTTKDALPEPGCIASLKVTAVGAELFVHGVRIPSWPIGCAWDEQKKATIDAINAAAQAKSEPAASDDALMAELTLARKLHWLAARDLLFFSTYNEAAETWGDGAHQFICCNDIFVPAADAEGLATNEIDAYLSLCVKYKDDAPAAWCAAKRNANPWRNHKINEEARTEAERLIAAIAATQEQKP